MLLSNGTLTPTGLGDTLPSFGGVGDQHYATSGLRLSNAFASYGAVYRSQVWIATLVNKVSYGTARLPLKVYERDADGARNEVRDSPMARLLRNPNPRHDRFFFWLWTASTQEVYGEAMWVKIRPRPGAAPSQLWPLHPANVAIYRNKDTGELIYRYAYGVAAGEFLEWPARDVVHFKTYNPDDQLRGLSRLEPLRQTILNEDASRRAAQAMWSNGGRPSMTLTSPRALSETAFKRLDQTVKGIHQGVDNWGKIAILEEGLTPTVIPLSASEMQFIEQRNVSRDEACGMYDVPPPAVHILDRATFSNITEQMRSLYRETQAPRLGLYESTLDAQLRPDFDATGSLYAEFLLDEVLRGDFEQRAAANQAAIFSGQRTPNEVRRQDNLPPLPGGDTLFINQGAAPLSTGTEDSTADALASSPFSNVGLPALIAAGILSPQDGRDLLRIPGTAPGLPNAQDGQQNGQVVEAEVEKCLGCNVEAKSSERGLCRSCEGKVGRLLTQPKEIEA